MLLCGVSSVIMLLVICKLFESNNLFIIVIIYYLCFYVCVSVTGLRCLSISEEVSSLVCVSKAEP